jgi:hypothetical protein
MDELRQMHGILHREDVAWPDEGSLIWIQSYKDTASAKHTEQELHMLGLFFVFS